MVRSNNQRFSLAVCSFILVISAQAFAQVSSPAPSIPSHPRELKYSALHYTPPKVSNYRRVLANGVVAFLAEDHDFPLVQISVLIRAGSYVEPKGKEGLAAMTGSQMRAGGTATLPPDKFDE